MVFWAFVIRFPYRTMGGLVKAPVSSHVRDVNSTPALYALLHGRIFLAHTFGGASKKLCQGHLPLRPLPGQMFGFRPRRQCLDIVSFLVEELRIAEEWSEKLSVISMDVASAFDAVRAEILGDALLERGALRLLGSCRGKEKTSTLLCRPCLGHMHCTAIDLEVGSRQGGPRTPSGWNQLVATLVGELVRLKDQSQSSSGMGS